MKEAFRRIVVGDVTKSLFDLSSPMQLFKMAEARPVEREFALFRIEYASSSDVESSQSL
jgi:hypothetical protein